MSTGTEIPGAFRDTESERSLLDPYALGVANRCDELVEADGRPRAHWDPIARGLDRLGIDELHRRRGEIERLLERDGVTYNAAPGSHRESYAGGRSWLLDPVPMVLPWSQWERIERGVKQRTELLDLIMTDIYGSRSLVGDGSIPASVLLSDPQFLRGCHGVRLPTPRQLVVSATDLVNTADRGWLALSHRTQAPSGAAYAMENRRVVSRVFPRLFHGSTVQRLAAYVRALRSAMRAVAPAGVDDPSIVVLSPGPFSETAFEHASIAAQMGYPLVQGSDLRVSDGRVWLRTVGDRVPVDVILRRVDATSCDPLELDPESTLGVPGLLDACRRGVVSVVNPLGAGVLENAALLSLLPRLCRTVLGEDLELPGPDSWWCGTNEGLVRTVSGLGDIVVRSLSRSSLDHSVDTSMMSSADLDALRARITSEPQRWVGQQRVEPTTTPALGAGGLVPRPAVLRTFVVGTHDYLVMSGGMARVAADDSGRPITNRSGALSKDVWVVGGSAEVERDYWLGDLHTAPNTSDLPSASAAENLFWMGRYAERGEFTVRLLRAAHGRLDEFGGLDAGPGAAALQAIVDAVNFVTGAVPATTAGPGDIESELWRLLVDGDRPGAVAHSLGRMASAIDSVRDQMSVDTWVVVGSLDDRLQRLRSQPDHEEAATDALNDMLQGLLAFAGLSHESMVRDRAWHFTEAGRRIERAVGLVSLIEAVLAVERTASTESLILESLLTVGESIITYRRRYRSRAAVSTVLDLLLTDAGNPRSLRFQVDHLARALAALDVSPMVSGAAIDAVDDIIRLVDGLSCAKLATPNQAGSRVALTETCRVLLGRLRDASDALSAQYFIRSLPQHSLATRLEPSYTPGGQP